MSSRFRTPADEEVQTERQTTEEIRSGYRQALNEIEDILPDGSVYSCTLLARQILGDAMQIAYGHILDDLEDDQLINPIENSDDACDEILRRANYILSRAGRVGGTFPRAESTGPGGRRSTPVLESNRPIYLAVQRLLNNYIELDYAESGSASTSRECVNQGLARIRKEVGRYVTRYVPLESQERTYDIILQALNPTANDLRDSFELDSEDAAAFIRSGARELLEDIAQGRVRTVGTFDDDTTRTRHSSLRDAHRNYPGDFSRALEILRNIGLGLEPPSRILGSVPRRTDRE